MSEATINTLFLDIGGVLLTNGWDRTARALAAKEFNLDLEELNERHHLCFDSYERGRLSMDEYLKQVVFYERRSFMVETFKDFIYSRSEALTDNIEFFKALKAKYGLKVFAVNNEAKEINEYRIKQFKLHQLFDAFVSSCYVGLRKPDSDIFRFACALAQTTPREALMIDDRKMFVEVASGLGLNAVVFTNVETVQPALKELGLSI